MFAGSDGVAVAVTGGGGGGGGHKCNEHVCVCIYSKARVVCMSDSFALIT